MGSFRTITREIVTSNTDKLFLFGDNDQRTGYGGQAAAMRGCRNSLGIRTKCAPSWAPTAFYSDTNYAENCRKIDEDFAKIPANTTCIVIPTAGIGTGRARLEQLAPRTFAHLQSKFQTLIASGTI